MPERVLVILTETSEHGLTGPGREALGFGLAAADDARGCDVALFAASDGVAAVEARERGAARVFAFGGAPPATGAALVAAAHAAVEASGADLVVVNRGGPVLDLVPRLAARLGGGCVQGVTELRRVEGELRAVAAVYGGAARAIYRFKGDGVRVVSLAPGAAEPPPREAGRAGEVISLTLPAEADDRVRVVEPLRPPEGARLEDARVVVSGGRGLKDSENYGLIRELAAALGGLPGASRAIVDDAWAKPAEQVGLTGKIVTPQVYIAAGISGASQHMAGCSNSKLLVAINTDPDAPIFRYAHLGIVDNCLDVLPELIRLARERAAR
jgi:electron transfer flavoprotein alpha subunit